MLYLHVIYVHMAIFKKCCFIREAWLRPCLSGFEFRAEYSPGISWTWSEEIFFWSAFFLWHRLKELEEKSRKWESRSEDTHLISCLQDKLSEREEIIKQLVVRFPFICTYIFWNLLEGSVECFIHCFRLIFFFCSGILWQIHVSIPTSNKQMFSYT